ncbi:MAG: chloride channel protein [Clostridia bacterium]|nr:chloride channel protein [Clostridia bacterium]
MELRGKCIKYITYVFKWASIGILIGVFGGLIGTFFHISVDYVTTLRENNFWLIFFLPIGGLLIAAIYKMFVSKGNIDTQRVFQSVKEDKDVPIVMIPLIFIGTVITHMLGGSAGREGAALQLGGSMGYNVAKALKQNGDSLKLIVTSGMSSVFSALFGTPLAATVFSLEVTKTRTLNFRGLLPGFVSSLVAVKISQFFGVAPIRFDIPTVYEFHLDTILKVAILAILCAGVCIIFATSIHKTEFFMTKHIPNSYIRAFFGGLLIIVLTIIAGTEDYNGAGMDVIKRAILGDAKYEAFILKIVFTAITIAAGFKGGEIVPTFFIGSTFGCMASGFLGLNKSIGAPLGFVALFAGMTKCPIAAFLLALEVFGIKGMLYFAIAVVVAYMLSGRFGLYENTNKMMLSRTNSGTPKLRKA